MLTRLLKRIREYTGTLILLSHYKPRPGKQHGEGKSIFVNIRRNYFTRYLYLFLKFFHQEGYAIYLPRRLKLINELKNDLYASFLLSEKIVILGTPSQTSHCITIDQDKLSPAYFSVPEKNASRCKSLHVPMTQHPIMYHAGFWNAPIEFTNRKKSVFMAGNLDPVAYDTIEKDGIFAVMSRNAVYSYLAKRQLLFQISDKNELQRFLINQADHKIILVNRLHFDIPMNELRQLLSQFEFYFALPGVVMPFSHNVIEAMSVGTIPFIQEEYANLFRPSLTDGLYAVTFKDYHDLEKKLEQALNSSAEYIEFLRNNVFQYYNDHLLPGSLVKKIEQGNYHQIYLQAEHYSIELLKKEKLNT